MAHGDETGIDDNEVPMMGWSKKGERCYDKKRAFKTNRINITAMLYQGKIIAPLVFTGHTTGAIFETYLEEVLLPVLPAGTTIVIDNARFHKTTRAMALVKAKGCSILFLPPYSPDLNPIEHYWTPLKERIRYAATRETNFFEAVIETLHTMCVS